MKELWKFWGILMDKAQLSKNYQGVLNTVKNYDGARLLLATKMQSCEDINYLVSKGAYLIGENKVNELLEKYEGYDKRAEIHFIGTLQSNKVKYIIDKVSLIHSVDKLSLLEEIDKRAKKIGKVMDVLVEVHSGREEAKGGILPEDVADFIASLSDLEFIRVRGLMTMAPKCTSREEYLKYFTLTRELFDKLFKDKSDAILSMGMSESYTYAIEAGATMVRIGSAIFGERKYY